MISLGPRTETVVIFWGLVWGLGGIGFAYAGFPGMAAGMVGGIVAGMTLMFGSLWVNRAPR